MAKLSEFRLILFQFTRAGERATLATMSYSGRKVVSIHARWGARDNPAGGFFGVG